MDYPKVLDLEKGTKVYFELKDSENRVKKLPTALDWKNLIFKLPEEKVKIDKNGNYDPKKSPNFHDWMVNG
ncbi:AbrB family transcriptional regulator [uncultured Lactobacillus sp.]|uniref:AbrB family transcriptional regulator n=1 Tax=uncultured Lactobacillus sp. TaxID=153152 RepID=UPI002729AAA2|nr:AbrB family transcriptional regulator [uncultured Lactobacillus sp.]